GRVPLPCGWDRADDPAGGRRADGIPVELHDLPQHHLSRRACRPLVAGAEPTTARRRRRVRDRPRVRDAGRGRERGRPLGAGRPARLLLLRPLPPSLRGSRARVALTAAPEGNPARLPEIQRAPAFARGYDRLAILLGE